MNCPPICQYAGCTEKGKPILNGLLVVACDKHEAELKEMLRKAQMQPEFQDLLTKYIQSK
jgi:hypothetical protein